MPHYAPLQPWIIVVTKVSNYEETYPGGTLYMWRLPSTNTLKHIGHTPDIIKSCKLLGKRSR